MKKLKLENITYEVFKDFLSSNKDEQSYFKLNVSDVIPLEEYLRTFKIERDKYVTEVKPIIMQIKDKNHWINGEIVTIPGKIKFNSTIFPYVTVGTKNNYLKSCNAFDNDLFPYSTISNFSLSIDSLYMAYELINNSFGEISKMLFLANVYLYSNTNDIKTLSNIFNISPSTSNISISVQCRKLLHSLFYIDISNNDLSYKSAPICERFIDTPLINSATQENYELLNSAEMKKLVKKLYIKK